MFEKLKYLLLEYKPRRMCKKCSEEKLCDDFYWAIKGVCRHGSCKKCYLAAVKKYAGSAKGKAVAKKANKKYAGTAKGKAIKEKADKKYNSTAKAKETLKKYAGSAKGKAARKKHAGTAKRKASNKKYTESAKGKANRARKDAKRRSKIEGVINNLSAEQWEHILKNQKHCCNGCKESFTEEKPATKDHIVPVDKDGGLTKDNVQALCGLCNSIKGPRPMKYLVEVLEKKEI